MKKKTTTILLIISILVLCLIIGFLAIFYFKKQQVEEPKEVVVPVYLASENAEVNIYRLIEEKLEEVNFVRGTKADLSDQKKLIGEVEYNMLYIDGNTYYTNEDILVNNKQDCVKEKQLWVYRTCTSYKDDTSSEIAGLVLKGTKIDIIGTSMLKEDGTVDRYKSELGYILTKYLTDDETFATSEDNSSYATTLRQETDDSYGAGSIATLDYYPNEKVVFKDNVMPKICKALYINLEALYDIEDYIDYALTTNINTFVVDIKDSDVISVKADTMKKWSPTSYDRGVFDKEEYVEKIKKINDAGLYTVARITVFKDTYFIVDHPECAILDKNDNNNPFYYGASLWPSAFSRDVWQYNVELSKEAICDFGFKEIQYDYVRFPEQIDYYADILDALDLQNTYLETRAEAIQRFLMYACDEVHSVNAYVSADVFGETANNYVCAYGQYLPAISNVVDVVSPMPYPDHFNIHDYGIASAVWEVPYDLIKNWGVFVKKQQERIPTPAKMRSYIQGYNSIREPYVIYDSNKIAEQIQGLIDSDIYDGFIIWNAGSYLDKYESFKEALTTY